MSDGNKNSKLITFLVVWFGQFVSIIGTALSGFVLGIWVYKESGSVTNFALIVLFANLPGILLSPIAGTLVDRWDRRKVMIMSNAGSGLCTLTMVALLLSGNLKPWQICIALSFNSVFGAFQWPAYAAITTLLVPKEQLGRASGLVQFGPAVAQVMSPMAAGALIQVLPIEGIMMIDFASYLVAITTLLIVRLPRVESDATAGKDRPSLIAEAAQGWTYIASRPGLLSLLIFFTAINFTGSMVNVLTTPLLLNFASSAVVGTVASVFGAGMLIGSITMGLWGGPKRRVYAILGFGLVQGAALILSGVQPNALLIGAAVFGLALGLPIVNGCSQAIWQSKTLPNMQGRVFAIRRMIAMSSAPISYLIAGPLADRVFEPLLVVGGPLEATVGRIIGTGPGRGIGLLLIIMGLLTLVITAVSYMQPRLVSVEEDLPDAIGERAVASV